MRKHAWYFLLFALILPISTQSDALAQFDPELFAGMKARSIGPAGMSGRIGTIEAVASNPNIIYVGSATGGVWKSINGGITWKPIFDDQPASSIGAVAVFQANPSIVWVGTGEGNPRNSVGVGNGIYKSLNAGDSWVFLGLEKTEKIHRVVLHPSNSEVAYVAALGTTWGENPERGVFKTTDGGKSWQKILFVDERTGCADLVMDPSNPNKLFAAMWEHRRWPWFFKSGGPGSGLYLTYDGGETWQKITSKDGLPEGELGRIGVAIAKSNPEVVYALVEAKKSALCRSDDGGKNWKIVNQSPNVNPRPFYYADIRVDPQNENRVYSLHTNLVVSEDGGKTFERIRSRIHSDHHALWIHPDNGNFMIDGNDGGVAISYDRGQTWRFVENLPLAQYYHINIDMELPYNVYGGMQDNGSWCGPSDVWETGGIRNYHWEEVGFGDGFATLSDPHDPVIGYSMSQGGYLTRFNRITGERKDIRPAAPDGIELRFNWNAAIAIDPFEPNTVYYGSQFVHKSTDRGDSWQIISPDLTTNDPEKQRQIESGGLTYDVTHAENHCTILTIAPSPVQRGAIWVGTDDGNVQVTRDGGKNWENVVKNIPDLPANTWCPHIEPSKFDAGTAYVVFDDHQRSNWTTYIYKTENFGKKWESLTKNDPTASRAKNSPERWGFVHVIEQDPVNKNLLYLGTEFGLFISFDDGKNWMKWKHGVPTVPVRALIVHPREHDLVIGTHGRAAFILDDVRPLRSISKSIIERPLHIFEVPTAYQHTIRPAAGYHFPADAMFSGEGRPYGAMISYYLIPPDKTDNRAETQEPSEQKDASAEEQQRAKEPTITIEILDSTQQVIRKFDGPMKKGINRAWWDLRRDGWQMPSITGRARGFAPAGPEVLPGTYYVKIKLGNNEAIEKFQVLPDPRVSIPMAERLEKYQTLLHVGQRIEVVTEAVERIRKVEKSVDLVLEKINEDKEAPATKELKTAANELKKRLKQVLHLFVDDATKQGITRQENVSRKLWYVSNSLTSSWEKPTDSQMMYLHQAEEAMQKALDQFNQLFEKDVADFQLKLKQANFSIFPTVEPLNMDWKKR
ncbi:MAG: hypothetical protein ONB31_08430 [candidate division KSB1 bacterium]|nr:hypothetical protein [candidate division KSB1 bacterium]MDZ7358123.1 hypothetical protein [candidate division KSB1 bacterium]MDZ7400787.1 hypothetical protein [candidate division KSB1 bacterium]